MDKYEERFDTYKEKRLSLHSQFKKPEIQKKVRKEVEQLVENLRITKEAVWRARENNILKDEDNVKPKEAKPKTPPPKPRRKRNSAPSSRTQKPLNSPKPQAEPSGGAVKRKKEQPQIIYATTFSEKEET